VHGTVLLVVFLVVEVSVKLLEATVISVPIFELISSLEIWLISTTSIFGSSVPFAVIRPLLVALILVAFVFEITSVIEVPLLTELTVGSLRMTIK
jgi:hypothetical protein